MEIGQFRKRRAVAAVGHEHEGAVEPGTEAVGHQVVRAAGREVGGVVAGVREAELESRDRRDEHAESEEAGEHR